MSSRRTFFTDLLALGAAGMLAPSMSRALAAALTQNTPDRTQTLFTERLTLATTDSLSSLPIGDVMAAIGRSFIGFPYEAHTLEGNAVEQLVARLDVFDCVSFVENVFAISLCVKKNTLSFDDYRAALRTLRYRGGVIDGYPSRLHYFTEWIVDNEKKGLVHDITRELGGIRVHGSFSFMSTHPESYAQLRDHDALKKIEETERGLSVVKRFLIPRDRVESLLSKMRNGDIIALGTKVKGIDFSHTGMVAVDNGTVKFLHAPLSTGAVQLSAGSLAQYVGDRASSTGILVARPIEPA